MLNTLETSGEDVQSIGLIMVFGEITTNAQIDIDQVVRLNYTRNEWERCENYTRSEWRRCENYTPNE